MTTKILLKIPDTEKQVIVFCENKKWFGPYSCKEKCGPKGSKPRKEIKGTSNRLLFK